MLRRFEYRRLPRADRGPVLAYLQRLSIPGPWRGPLFAEKRAILVYFTMRNVLFLMSILGPWRGPLFAEKRPISVSFTMRNVLFLMSIPGPWRGPLFAEKRSCVTR